MKVFLEADDYYTQRNNKIDPYSTCMPTARVMWYIANKIPYVNYMPATFSDDDFFSHLLRSEEAKKFCNKKYSWVKDMEPRYVHGMYGSWLDQRVTGKRRSDFVTDLSFDDVFRRVSKGEAVMTSGSFMGQTKPIEGHAFVFVGVDDNECLLMADPYGNFHTNYESAKGYLVPMSRMEYLEHVKPLDSHEKWGHILI